MQRRLHALAGAAVHGCWCVLGCVWVRVWTVWIDWRGFWGGDSGVRQSVQCGVSDQSPHRADEDKPSHAEYRGEHPHAHTPWLPRRVCSRRPVQVSRPPPARPPPPRGSSTPRSMCASIGDVLVTTDLVRAFATAAPRSPATRTDGSWQVDGS